jgi:hypothetical protein
MSKLAFPNTVFNAPSTEYYRVQYLISTPDDPVMGTGYHREQIELQVFVCTEIGKGDNGLALAETLRTYFPKGYTAVQDGYQIHVLSTPKIQGSILTDERLITPVMFNFLTEVHS